MQDGLSIKTKSETFFKMYSFMYCMYMYLGHLMFSGQCYV